MPVFEHCIRNNQLIPLTEANISVTNIELSYGFGVYESLRVVDGKALHLSAHIDRLFRSASIIGLEHHLTSDDIDDSTNKLVEACSVQKAFNLKMLLIGGRTKEDTQFFILPLSPVFPEKKWYRDGISTITYPFERPFPQSKTLSMLGSYLAYREAKKHGCYDALLINRVGDITEGTRTNFLAIRGDTIVEPPEQDILPGITRMHVLKAIERAGLKKVNQPIRLTDISTFDGAFLTSTSSRIMPIRSINDHRWAIIPDVTKKLIEVFDGMEKKQE